MWHLGRFTKTPYLVLFVILGTAGIGTAYAGILPLITLAGDVQVDGDLNVDGTITGDGSLGGLSCSTNQVARFDGSIWVCRTISLITSAIVVDTGEPNTGADNSLAVVNGKPAISYQDRTNRDLKYVQANDADGTSWNTPVTVDAGGPNTGGHTSLAVVNGKPAISYYDGTNEDLKYVQANDADGTSWPTAVTVDSGGEVGQFNSLVVVNGKPAISYYEFSNIRDLKYVQASDADGTSWPTAVTVDSGSVHNTQTSLAVVNGKPAISYGVDGVPNDLKYVQANDADGNSWKTPVIADSTCCTSTGESSSLAVVNGMPAISYSDSFGTNNLKYVQANDADGTTWQTEVTVDAGTSRPGDTSLAVVNGKPAISYYDVDNSGNLLYVQANDADGTSWPTAVTVDSGGDVGKFSSLAVVNGKPAISYRDGTNLDLKYVQASDADGIQNWFLKLIFE